MLGCIVGASRRDKCLKLGDKWAQPARRAATRRLRSGTAPCLAKFNFPSLIGEVSGGGGSGAALPGSGARAGEGDSRDVCCFNSCPGLWAAVSVQGCALPCPVNPCCMPKVCGESWWWKSLPSWSLHPRGDLISIHKPLAVKVPESCSLSQPWEF